MSEQRPPNKRQLQAAATRERMLGAAREVFESRGYKAATIGAITSAADTAHGTFYLYFRNKDDAFAQVMASVSEELREAQRPGPTDDRFAGLESILYGFVSVFVQHAGLWRALLEGMLQSEKVEQIWLDNRAAFIERLARRLEREQQEGLIRDLDCRQTALALGSMAEWYAFTNLVLAPDGVGEEQLAPAVTALTDLWYHALYGSSS